MDPSCYQPVIGFPYVAAPPESSRKSETSKQESQEIFAKLNKGAVPNKNLSEEDPALRNIIDGRELPSQEFQDKLFISEPKIEKKPKKEYMQTEEAKERAKAHMKQMLDEFMGSCDYEPPYCEVCKEVGDHYYNFCPYLDCIPNLEKATIGEDYEIHCQCCHKLDHGHPDGSWVGYAARKIQFWEISDQDSESESESDKEPLYCDVCMMVVDHWSCQCPYLDRVPNPENTPVGEGYEIRCRHCNKSDHGHPDGSWTGYAWWLGWD